MQAVRICCLVVVTPLVAAAGVAQTPDRVEAVAAEQETLPTAEDQAPAAEETPPGAVPATGGEEPGTQPTRAEPPKEPPAAARPEPAEPPVGASRQPEPMPLPPDQPLAVEKLLQELKTASFWLTLLVALVFGGAGGVVYELLILQGAIEWPHRTSDTELQEPLPYAVAGNLLDLGVWARVIIGGLAAIAAVWILSPETALGLVAGAIVAGSAGTSVFRSLQDRLLATLAQKEAAEVRSTSKLQLQKVSEALQRLEAAQAAGAGGKTTAAAVPGASDVAEAERLLLEARGIGETL